MSPYEAAALRKELNSRSQSRVQAHWDAYLKGNAEFLGVPMAGVRATVNSLWDSGLSDLPTTDQREIFTRWARQPYTEERLAAVLLLAEHVMPALSDDDLERLEEPLVSGVFADWHIVDWYSTKVMSAYVAGGDRTLRSDTVLDWADAPALWQRRAAVVSFVPHAKQPREFRQDLPERLLIACDGNINASPERFAHTGVGWVLREMSVAEPTLVADYVAERPQLTSEARRMATARLRPGPYRRR
ncbi:MAG: hypothetical protein CMH41_08810 [Micrococcales bacterium]|nr:hypothetical protein [Micrococcales bacterium]